MLPPVPFPALIVEFESAFDTPIALNVLLLSTLEVSPHKDVASDRQLSVAC